jgi:peptidoglycan-N-acetylglucosamine deacetylase
MTRTLPNALRGMLLLMVMCAGCITALAQQPNLAQHPAGAVSSEKVDRRVVITMDDLPGAMPASDINVGSLADVQRYNRAITTVFRKHHAQAIGFVNEAKVEVANERDARAALLKLWIDAGLDLGNHTYSHPDFSTTPVQQYEDETIRGEVVTSQLLAAAGKQEHYFRHPYLSTGATAEARSTFEAFLKARGYQIAPVTVENADYEFNDVLTAALAANDKSRAEKIKAEYRAYTKSAFEFYEEASRKLFGREIPQSLLIHDNEINSEMLDMLLTDMEQRGYRFISLEEAMADPAYATPDLFVGSVGISWLERWKIALGGKPDYEHDPDPPAWITQEFNELRSHSK